MNVTTKVKPAAAVRPDLDPELNNLAMSKEAQPLFDAVMKHIQENVAPISDEFSLSLERSCFRISPCGSRGSTPATPISPR